MLINCCVGLLLMNCCVLLQAMGLMLLPQNAPDAIRNVAYMVDEIWYHAGDTSTDVSALFVLLWHH